MVHMNEPGQGKFLIRLDGFSGAATENSSPAVGEIPGERFTDELIEGPEKVRWRLHGMAGAAPAYPARCQMIIAG